MKEKKSLPHTVKGKAFALNELKKRRETKPDIIEEPDYVDVFDEYDVLFYCVACGHISDVKKVGILKFYPGKLLCNECQALKEVGWLE